MAYSQEYVAHMQKIEKYKARLRDLDSDYATLQECKKKLRDGSVLLNDLLIQCGDINKIFDRKTIEGKYDSCGITFDNKDSVFENLSNIKTSTSSFSSSCDDVKTQIDQYGTMLDDYCIDIAKEAQEVSNTISSLQAQSVYLMEPEPPNGG